MTLRICKSSGWLVSVLLLVACQTITNSPVAEDPFPAWPTSPDGVCPDFTGKYFPEATSEEQASYSRYFRKRELGFGNTITMPSERKKVLLPNGRYYVFPLQYVEIRQIDHHMVEVTKWYFNKEEASNYRARLIGEDQVCDKGVLIKKDVAVGGSEVGSTRTVTLELTTKEFDGSILKKEYVRSQGSALLVIPAGSTREVFTFRFKPYFPDGK